MSTAAYPPLPAHELAQETQATSDRELQWLLTSLQDTFASLKSGLTECDELLAPKEPGATLVVSSMRSEAVKGLITRVGTRLVKGDVSLRLPTLPPPPKSSSYPLRLNTSPNAPLLVLKELSSTRNIVNQAIDVIDASTWTGDPHNASFIAGQLHLLADLLREARATLKGSDASGVSTVAVAGTGLPSNASNSSGGGALAAPIATTPWLTESLDDALFDPPLPSTLSVHATIRDASIVLVFRTLHAVNTGTPTGGEYSLSGLSLRQRLGLAARLPEHDESDAAFHYRGQEVRVREKVRVESQDPSLMAVLAKVAALEHSVAIARRSLGAVRGELEDEE